MIAVHELAAEAVEILINNEFAQGWFHGGPSFSPRSLTDGMALGRGRLAFFEHPVARGFSYATVDLASGCWRLCSDGGTRRRGLGSSLLIRALKQTRHDRREN